MLPLLSLFPLLSGVAAVTTTPNTGDQTNGFLFDYVRAYNAPLPIQESCPAALTFGPVSVQFGGAEPAPPYTAMQVSAPYHHATRPSPVLFWGRGRVELMMVGSS